MKVIHLGTVEQGKIQFNDLKKLKMDIYKHEGKPVEMTISRKKKSRSLNENSYYWGVPLAILGDHLGYTPDEMNEAIKWQFLRVKRDGKPDTARSTKDLTTAEFEDLMSNIRRWGSIEFGVYIPEPNEVEWEL